MRSASSAGTQETKPASEMCTVVEQSTLRTKMKRERGPGNIAETFHCLIMLSMKVSLRSH